MKMSKIKNLHKTCYTCIGLLLVVCLLAGCGQTEASADKPEDRTIQQFVIAGLLESCVDEAGEYLYCIKDCDSAIYQYTMDGQLVAQFPVTADEEEKDIMGFLGEKPAGAINLSGLCIQGDTLYCYRALKGTIMSVNIQTGETALCAKTTMLPMLKMTAGENTLLCLGDGEYGKEIGVWDRISGTFTQAPIANPEMIAWAEGDTYWIEAYEEAEGYFFQEYKADTGELSQKYPSNFTYALTDMVYKKEEEAVFGFLLMDQYVRFNPREATTAARFNAQYLWQSPCCMHMAGEKIYVQDVEKDAIYNFSPAAYLAENKPLKGYIMSEFGIPGWAGYNVELEVISWEELALKVLAEDKDYDFVIMSTDMPEVTAIRDAMAYAPIPEEYVEKYWSECQPFVREAASYNGDIWMLPLHAYAKGLVYHEENLAKYDICMEDIKTQEDLCKAAQILYNAGQTGRYSLGYVPERLLQQYLGEIEQGEKVSFDTREFRDILDFVTGEYGPEAVFRESVLETSFSDWVYDEESALSYVEQYEQARIRRVNNFCMEETLGIDWDYEKYAGTEGFHVCPIPGVAAGSRDVQIRADVLIINPASPNMGEILKFVTDMSEIYIANPDNYLSADRACYPQESLYDDIYELYSQGRIVYALPEELFDGYWEYCAGQSTDQQAVIEELDRVVSMYYGE